MKNFVKSEPVITSAVVAAVVAIVGLATALGAPIDDTLAEAIQAATVAILPLVFLAVRGFVTPNGKVVEREQDGHVLAGEASELPTHTHVREVGDLSLEEDTDEGV